MFVFWLRELVFAQLALNHENKSIGQPATIHETKSIGDVFRLVLNTFDLANVIDDF